jgi:hypothetical protein
MQNQGTRSDFVPVISVSIYYIKQSVPQYENSIMFSLLIDASHHPRRFQLHLHDIAMRLSDYRGFWIDDRIY